MQTKMFAPTKSRSVKMIVKENTVGTEIAGSAEFDVITK